MAHATSLAPIGESPPPRRKSPRPVLPHPSPSTFRFRSLVLTEPRSLAKGRSTTLAASVLIHSVLLVSQGSQRVKP